MTCTWLVRQVSGVEIGFDYLRKYDASGNDIWTIPVEPRGARVTGLSVDSSGVYVANEAGVLAKYDATGSLVWDLEIGASAQLRDVDVEGSHVYVAGRTNNVLPGQTTAGPFLQKYDFDGNEVWTQMTSRQPDALDVLGSSIYVVGDSFVQKLDTGGNSIWMDQFPAGVRDVAADSSGVYVAGIVGTALPGQTHFGANDGFVRKYDVNGVEQWTDQFGTNLHDRFESIDVDASGVYVAGWVPGGTGSFGFQVNDALVRAYDLNGTARWTRQFAGDAVLDPDDRAYGIAVDAGEVYAVGFVSGNLPGQTAEARESAFVRKYDALGTEIWTRQFHGVDGPATDYASSVVVDGNIYVVGAVQGRFAGEAPPNIQDGFLRAYDPSGTVLWTRQFAPSGLGRTYPEDVAIDQSGIYVVGRQEYFDDAGDAFVRKFDFNGSEIWTREFGSVNYDTANAVAVDNDGVIVIGRTDASAINSNEAYMRKFDPLGNEIWNRALPRGAAEDIAIFAGDIFTTGLAFDDLTGNGFGGAYVRRYDSLGAAVWTQQFGTLGRVEALGAAVSETGVFVVGTARPSTNALRDAFLRRFDLDGNTVWVEEFGSEYDDQAFGVAVDDSAAYVVGNSRTSPSFNSSRDGFVTKFDLTGKEFWSTTVDGGSDDSANAIAFGNAGLFLAGSTAGELPGQTRAGGSDAFAARLDPGEIFNVDMEVNPGNNGTATNLSGDPTIAVAVHSTQVAAGESLDFDATQVDSASVVFAGATPVQSDLVDIDHDGDLDLVMRYLIAETALLDLYAQALAEDINADGILDSKQQAIEASLEGLTFERDYVFGSDDLQVFLSGSQLRDLLSIIGDVTAFVDAGTLHIVGDKAPNDIKVDMVNGLVRVSSAATGTTVNGRASAAFGEPIHLIMADMGGGDDSVLIDLLQTVAPVDLNFKYGHGGAEDAGEVLRISRSRIANVIVTGSDKRDEFHMNDSTIDGNLMVETGGNHDFFRIDRSTISGMTSVFTDQSAASSSSSSLEELVWIVDSFLEGPVEIDAGTGGFEGVLLIRSEFLSTVRVDGVGFGGITVAQSTIYGALEIRGMWSIVVSNSVVVGDTILSIVDNVWGRIDIRDCEFLANLALDGGLGPNDELLLSNNLVQGTLTVTGFEIIV